MWSPPGAPPGDAEILTHFVNFCWSLFKFCLLLVLLGGMAVGGYLYLRIDDEIRRQVESRFANHYRNFVVKVGSARFDPERGIAINDFSLAPRASDGSAEEPVIAIEEMYLAGKLRIEQLVTNQLRIAEVIVRRADLRLKVQKGGQWNTAALLPLPHFSDDSPTITIEDASATVENAAMLGGKPWSLKGVDLKLVPLPRSDRQVRTSPHFSLVGSAGGLPARDFRISGEIGDGECDATLTVAGLDLSPRLLTNLPDTIVTKLGGAEFTGTADVAMRIRRTNAQTPVTWSAAFRVDRGRLGHPLLPEQLTDVALTGRADSGRLAIDRLDARCGPASVALALNRAGWSASAPLAMTVKVMGFPLSERVATTLPESKSRIWQRFRPTGPIDAEVKLTFDGKSWRPVVTADCRGISLTDQVKFPYVLTQTTGRVSYGPVAGGEAEGLRLDLTGFGSGRPVKIVAELSHLAAGTPRGPVTGEGVAADETAQQGTEYAAGFRGVRYQRAQPDGPTHPLGFVEISGTDIPLHDQLVEALPTRAQSLVRSLNGQGAVDFRFRAEWKEPAQRLAEVTQDIVLKECRIRYAPFPFPLQHIHGLVTQRNSEWQLNDVAGRGNNDSTVVRCRGTVRPQDSGCAAELEFEGANIPLDENLKLALTPTGRQAWNELNPQGYVDVTARVTRQPNELEPNVEIALRPRGQSVSIVPRSFPYRLDELAGTANYKRGRVDWQNVSARHDRSVYSIESGNWQVTGEDGWQCNLTNVNVDRLTTNRDLIAALPPAAQTVIERLQPSGTIGLYNSSFRLAKDAAGSEVAIAWDLNLECQQAMFQGAAPLHGVTGGIHLVGQSKGRTSFGAGELALDSIISKGIQFTNVRGPFWADSTACLFGEPACRQQNQPPRRLTADAYGGSLAANLEIAHNTIPTYKADVQLGGASLERFVNERLGGPNDMNGTVSGRLVVSGTGASPQTLRGGGEVHVVDAKIYKLTPLVAMLKMLRNRTPDTTAFNRCDMRFSIQGEHIHFDRLNLLGDAVSLYGNGETDLNRKLDLVFYTMVGPADLPIPLLRAIAGHVSQQGLQLKVAGTFDNPKIESQALPAVNDMLEQIQDELHQDLPATPAATATRGVQPTAK